MRPHAKASSAGSTLRQGSRLGRFFRGAFAFRGASSRGDGSGAPSAGRLTVSLLASMVILGTAVLLASVQALGASAPIVVTKPAMHINFEHAYLEGTVNPNGESTVYWFEYGTVACGAAPNPCTAVPASKDLSAGSGTEALFMSKAIGGLAASTTYHFRVVAENASGPAFGLDETFTTPAEAGASSCPNAVRRAEQHAAFLPDCRAYEMVSPADKNGNDIIGEASRIRASAGETPGLPAAVNFSAFAAFAEPQGTGIATEYLAQRDATPGTSGWSTHAISPRSDALSLLTNFFFNDSYYLGDFSPDFTTGVFKSPYPLTEDPNVEAVPNLYLRTDLRNSGRGSYQLLTPSSNPLSYPPNYFSKMSRPWLAGATTDFKHVLFDDRFNRTADAGGLNLKLFKNDDGNVHLVSDGTGTCPASFFSPAAPCSVPGAGVSSEYVNPHAISTDGSRVNFSGPIALFGQPTGETKLFQLDDQGTPSTADDAVIQINASEMAAPESPQAATYGTASADGSRVFFTTGEQLTEDAYSGGGLYMWERQEENEVQSLTVDATAGSFSITAHVGALEATTSALPFNASASEVQAALEALHGPAPIDQRLIGEGNVTVSGGPGGASPYEISFVGALAGVDVPLMSADGSALSGGTGTATVGTTNAVHNLTFIAPNSEVIGASEDGHRLYFTLVNWTSYTPVPGVPRYERSIFLWQDTGGTPGFSFVGGIPFGTEITMPRIWHPAPYATHARLTPDGTYLAFLSQDGTLLAPGYPHGHGPGNGTDCGWSCEELYVYSADTSTPAHPDVVCASCNLTEPEAGFDTLFRDMSNATGGVAAETSHEARNLTIDGSRVFFTTAEPLVSEDTNGRFDAYEYDLQTETYHLLSSGTDSSDSYFEDASANGRDAYIYTRQRLVGWDKDNAYDIYDVRVDGGFPEPPARPTAPCEGETCRGALLPAPAVSPVGSGQEGPGNRKPNRGRCPQGKHRVKIRGRTRCVGHHKSSKRAARSLKGGGK